jgi:hypothetical protein
MTCGCRAGHQVSVGMNGAQADHHPLLPDTDDMGALNFDPGPLGVRRLPQFKTMGGGLSRWLAPLRSPSCRSLPSPCVKGVTALDYA